MSLQTLIIASSPLLVVFQEAAENSSCTVTQLGENLYLSSWRWSDIESYVETDLVVEPFSVGVTLNTEGEEVETLFDPANTQPQEMTSDYLLKLKRDDKAGLFHPLIVEPDPEPRYKRVMSAEEFVRDLLGLQNWIKIETAALTNPLVGAWRDITVVGEVSLDHKDLIEGFGLTVSLGIFEQSEVDEFMKGILII